MKGSAITTARSLIHKCVMAVKVESDLRIPSSFVSVSTTPSQRNATQHCYTVPLDINALLSHLYEFHTSCL